MNGRRPLALVTGASSGIGIELARELARDGHDLVLTARSVRPMQSLSNELHASGATTTVISADLSLPGAAAALCRELESRELTVDVLINNAGLGAAGRFDTADPHRIAEMLYVNVVALTELTRLLLPGMIARGGGKIMLVASIAGFTPGPLMAVYFATKAFVLSFGEAIAYELRNTGITVTTVCPGATETMFFEIAGASRTSMANRSLRHMASAASVARAGYRALLAGRRVVVTGFLNRAFAHTARVMPHRITLAVTNALMH